MCFHFHFFFFHFFLLLICLCQLKTIFESLQLKINRKRYQNRILQLQIHELKTKSIRCHFFVCLIGLLFCMKCHRKKNRSIGCIRWKWMRFNLFFKHFQFSNVHFVVFSLLVLIFYGQAEESRNMIFSWEHWPNKNVNIYQKEKWFVTCGRCHLIILMCSTFDWISMLSVQSKLSKKKKKSFHLFRLKEKKILRI